MNALQSSKFAMFRVVEDLLDENQGIFAEVTAVMLAFEELREIIRQISLAAQKKSVIFTGIAVDKRNLKEALCLKASRFAGVVYAYGSTVKDYTLTADMNVSFSGLMRMTGASIAPQCQFILNRGAALLSELGDYGITQARIDDLQSAIDDFSAASVRPRVAKAERTVQVANLVALYKRADTLLHKKLDKLIDSFESEHSDFVHRYKASRIIIDPPRRSTKLKVFVTNKADKSPIEGATVTVPEANLTAQTNAGGEVLFKPIPHGKHTVRVTAENFADFETEGVEIKMGATKKLNIELSGV
jgi:hypothetical protein